MAKVTANWFREFELQVNDGRHQWVADLPADKGGSDVGPGAFDMLLGSLAACMCFVTKKYAQNSKLPVEDVIVEAEGNWVKDPGSGSSQYEIKTRLELKGDLSDSDIQRLARAAESCSVRRTITGALKISGPEVSRL